MNDSQFEIVLRELVELRAEVEVLRAANTTLLKVLVAFPAGQTPQHWMSERLRRAFEEHFERISQVLAAHGGGSAMRPPTVDSTPPIERPRGADSSHSPFWSWGKRQNA